MVGVFKSKDVSLASISLILTSKVFDNVCMSDKKYLC